MVELNNLRFFLSGIFFGIIFLFLFVGCKTTQNSSFEKLDLEVEKKFIQDSMDIPEEKKKYILDTFDRTESFCNSCILVNKELHSKIETLEEENKTLNEQAKIYRWVRNFILVSIVALIFWQFKDFIFTIAKKLVGL